MLDFLGVVENTWMPPSLPADEIDRLCMDHLMSDKSDMDFLVKFPEIFKEKMNDAQCKYLNYLIQGNLTVGEAGRLFTARKQKLMFIWTPSQYDMFIWKEKLSEAAIREAEER